MSSPNALYEWYAGQDFDFPNLRVAKGQRLPDKWQHSTLARRLQETYGKDAVTLRCLTPVPEAPAKSKPRVPHPASGRATGQS